MSAGKNMKAEDSEWEFLGETLDWGFGKGFSEVVAQPAMQGWGGKASKAGGVKANTPWQGQDQHRQRSPWAGA